MGSSRRQRGVLAGAVTMTALSLVAACGGTQGTSGSGEPAGKDPESFTVYSANENATVREQLDALAEGACSAQNEALPLEHQTVAQADVVQKVTLLASQDALPTHFIAGTDMIRPDGDLGQQGSVQDLEAALKKAGAWENVLPAVASTEERVYGGMVSMPYQYNIEGIWYNKSIFAEHDLSEPATWEELVDAAETLKQAGVIPMTQAGAEGWPITRLIGMYIYRNVGPEAMVDIRDGKAKLTDPEYLAAAEAIAEFTTSGYLGEGFSTRAGDVSTNLFLTGEAAMTYDGSWLLGDINDPEQNKIGADNVGFIPFPAVEGGAGNVDQYPANAGAAMVFASEQFGPKVSDWVACISENYGAQALQSAGIISGFTVNDEVSDVPPITAEIQQQITEIDETVLWFEALFDPKTNSLASTDMTLLTTGKMTPEEYMADLQDSVDAAR